MILSAKHDCIAFCAILLLRCPHFYSVLAMLTFLEFIVKVGSYPDMRGN